MFAEMPEFPSPEQIKHHVLISLHRYWPNNQHAIAKLPIKPIKTFSNIDLPMRLISVKLPEWAYEAGVNGELLIPIELLPSDSKKTYTYQWNQVDWFLAAFIMLEAWHERVWEALHGPIHSYSFRLRGWDERFWQRAWVNRIALFLRLWAAHSQKIDPEVLFGSLPASKILMTHDVDAVEKTLTIRLKQGAFSAFNAIRLLANRNPKKSLIRFNQALRFIFGRENWWMFEGLLEIEEEALIKGIFHFYADQSSKTLKKWLFDPNYDIRQSHIKKLIFEIKSRGHQLGLHPSFESWNDGVAIAEQKVNLESLTGTKIKACRQHWLRFSWHETWSSQEVGGMNFDTTLMFNDRPGFRNASALSWQPWNIKINKKHKMVAEPSVLMDSHFYDYQTLSDIQRNEYIFYWINECKMVHGEMAVLWHPHTLTKDYGWASGFDELILAIRNLNNFTKHESK